MDRRKLYVDKQETFYNTLNSKELNLEIAKNIELLVDMKDLLRVKAIQSYDENKQNSKVFTISTKNSSLEEHPKLLTIVSVLAWFMLYRRRMVGKLSLLWGGLAFTVLLNLSKFF